MRECNNCLLTSVDYPLIQLDVVGVCDICTANLQRLESVSKNIASNKLEIVLKNLKCGKKYDCILGVSGGLDSTYLVLKAMEWGLNPLLIHIDGGWNTAQAQENIKKTIKISGFDYETVVLDWEALKDFQYAFVQAHVVDIDLPFDNLLLSYMYRTASKHGIKHILMGYNSTTEGIMPTNFTHYKNDKLNILDIYKRFGRNKKHSFKFFGTLDFWWFEKVKKIRFIEPLDLIPYDKEEVKRKVVETFAWEDFTGKHHENTFTRFYQDYVLVEKFNLYKYKSHLSILVCSKQLTQEDARILFEKYQVTRKTTSEEDISFFCKKLGISEQEFHRYITTKPIPHTFYKSELNLYKKYKPLYVFVKRLFRFSLH
jgi:N-acetyl sugar amidotransferase